MRFAENPAKLLERVAALRIADRRTVDLTFPEVTQGANRYVDFAHSAFDRWSMGRRDGLTNSAD